MMLGLCLFVADVLSSLMKACLHAVTLADCVCFLSNILLLKEQSNLWREALC